MKKNINTYFLYFKSTIPYTYTSFEIMDKKD